MANAAFADIQQSERISGIDVHAGIVEHNLRLGGCDRLSEPFGEYFQIADILDALGDIDVEITLGFSNGKIFLAVQ